MKLLRTIQKINPAVLVIYAVASLVISVVFLNQGLEKLIRSRTPSGTVTMTLDANVNPQATPGYEVWIIGIVGESEQSLSEVLAGAIQCEGFEYRSAAEYGYSVDTIVNTAGQEGVLVLPWAGKGYIKFWKQNFSGIVHIETNTQTKTVDLYSAEAEQYEQVEISSQLDIPMGYQVLRYGCIAVAAGLLFLVFLLGTVRLIGRDESSNANK